MLESMKKCFELYFGSLYQFWYISVFIATSSKKLDKRIYSSNQMKLITIELLYPIMNLQICNYGAWLSMVIMDHICYIFFNKTIYHTRGRISCNIITSINMLRKNELHFRYCKDPGSTLQFRK